MSIHNNSQKQKSNAKTSQKKKGRTTGQPVDAAAIASPVIRVKVGDACHRVTPETLDDTEELTKLIVAGNDDSGATKIYLDDLLRFADEQRFRSLDFASKFVGASFVVAKKKHEQLLDAVLHLPFDNSYLDTYAKGKAALLETAVLCYPAALEACASQIHKRLKEAGVTGLRTQDLVSECRKIQRQLQRNKKEPDAEIAAGKVHEHYPNAPVSADAVIPAGWRVTEDGIEKIVPPDKAQVIIQPAFLSERGVDIQRNTEMMTITWRRDEKWMSRSVDRGQLADSHRILALADSGLAVTSNNAKHVVQFLDDYEAANLEHLPAIRVTARMGWQGEDGEDGFLWGRTLITGADEGDGPPTIRFHSVEAGVDQLANGLHSKGTLNKWLAALDGLEHYPRALLALYCSFAAAILGLLKAKNFVFDLAGQTSIGKTVASALAASAWGDAEENEHGSMLSTWESTAVWRERAAEILNNMPLILDDTKNVRFPDDIAKTVYAFCQGRGRGRGTVNGIAHQGAWSSVLISNGEQPLYSFTKDGGTRARILSLWGSPFGSASPENGQFVTTLVGKLKSNYGHAGPAFVRFVAANSDQWNEWRKLFRQGEKHYRKQAGENTVAGRMAAHLAAIDVTSRIVHKALEIPWEWIDPIAPLYDELTSQSADADQSAAALRHVYEWACGHRDRFWCPNSASRDEPPGGWIGHWQKQSAALPNTKKKKKSWSYIGFLRPELERLLCDAGFEPKSIARQWLDRGWLFTSPETNCERTTKKMRLGSQTVQMVVVRKQALIEIGEMDEK